MKQMYNQPEYCWLLAVCITIFFLAGCQKETSTNTMKTNVVVGSTIIYTDINPDQPLACTPATLQPHVIGCSTVYSLDLNNDGTIDFSIAYMYNIMSMGVEGVSTTTITVIITSLNHSAVVIDSVFPLAMNTNDSISQGSRWKSDTTLTLKYFVRKCSLGCYTISNGNWFSNTDKFLGLQFKKGGKIYYGWALLAGDASVIRGYAYNSAFNLPILAGQTQ